MPELVLTGWLPKLKLVVAGQTAGVAARPVPETPTVWGLPLALSVNRTSAERAPEVVGLNCTGTRQFWPPPMGEVQVVAPRTKSPGLVPARAIMKVIGPLPEFEKVTFWVPEVVPTT